MNQNEWKFRIEDLKVKSNHQMKLQKKFTECTIGVFLKSVPEGVLLNRVLQRFHLLFFLRLQAGFIGCNFIHYLFGLSNSGTDLFGDANFTENVVNADCFKLLVM